MELAGALIAAVILAMVHLLAGPLHHAGRDDRSLWLSAGGGAAVAYVFLQLVPELHQAQQQVEQVSDWQLLANNHAYLVALLGLAIFYGVEELVKQSSETRRKEPMPIFWLHVGFTAMLNAMVGYLLVHPLKSGAGALVFFTLALAQHFLITDFAMHSHHRRHYSRYGRWILAAAVVGGAVFGWLLPLHSLAAGVMLSFLAGAIVLNVLKEELPDEKQGSFRTFALGAAGFAALIVVFG